MAHKIDWLNRPGTTGVTWNPVTGCTKISAGCLHCYAERMSKRLHGRFGYPDDDPFRVTLHPDRLDEPLRWRKPRTCFTVSMGDLFHEDVPFSYIRQIWNIMETANRHTFIVLTKRPQRMYEFLTGVTGRFAVRGYMAPLPNVIGMVTAENQEQADKRIPWLLRSPFAVRGVSAEPLLGSIDLNHVKVVGDSLYCCQFCGETGIDPGEPLGIKEGRICPECSGISSLDWIIVGPETGPGARPMHANWERGIRRQCRDAGVPYFCKRMSNGQPPPDDLAIREWPGVADV